MPQTLGDMVFKDLEINEYFQELYSSILKNYSIHVFGIKTISPDAINLNDSLRFADLLSKSTDKKKSDEHKQLAQEVVALLNTLYPDNEEIRYYLGSVLSNTSNYRGLQHIKTSYVEESLLELLYSQFAKQSLSVPDKENDYFFFSQKNVYDNLSNPYFSYSGPTSMGKSFIIRMYLREQVLNGIPSNYAIVVPTKALITEVTSKIITDFKNILNDKNYRVVNSSGSIALESKHNFIFVLTPERLLYLLISNPEINIDFLFIDEAHKISAKDKRSAFYYKVIDTLANRSVKPRMIFASPNIPNPEVYLKLIPNLDNAELYKLSSDYSPVSQLKFNIDLVEKKITVFNGITKNLRDICSINGDPSLSRVVNKVGADKQNIVYCNSKNKAVNFALEFGKLRKKINDPKLSKLAKDIRNEVHGDYYLADLIEKGIAYHIGYLPSNIRLQIEDLYREEKINTVFCTSTLVEGINLPADNLFVTSYKNGLKVMNEVEFKNLMGRVGRIEYNLYGNVYLVRLQQNDKKEKFESLLVSDVPEQKLSLVTELSNNQKKKIIQSLKDGDVEFSKHPKTQNEDEYDLMRKFGLILLKDINENNESLVKQEFARFLSADDEQKIKAAFAERKQHIDDNINLSVDQTSSLVGAIQNGLEYPAIINNSIDYNELLSFLEKLSSLFKWEIYERNTLGHISKYGEHGKLKWYAVILTQWIQGNGLSFIISAALSYKNDNPSSSVKIDHNSYVPYDGTPEHNNIIIGEILSTIDEVILFKIANYFLKFSTEYKEFHNLKEMDNDWYEYVEYGTTNPLTILLQKSGFTRESATYIRQHQSEFVVTINGRPRLSRNLLNCSNQSVRNEADEIVYNAPDLFVEE